MGFIIYQLGISMIELPRSYLSEVANSTFAPLFPGRSADLFAVFLQFGGGTVAILGLIIAISGVAAPRQIEARYVQVPAQISAKQTQPLMQQFTCKFCGAEIEKDEVFCLKCRKAQR